MKNEHTAMVYIHWNEHTDRYTQYLVPYDIAKAIDKLLEKIEQIVNSWDGSIVLCENDWKYISEIKKVLEQE